jgi:hypothetical protein
MSDKKLINLVKNLRVHQKIYMEQKYSKKPNEDLKSFHGETIKSIVEQIDKYLEEIEETKK